MTSQIDRYLTKRLQFPAIINTVETSVKAGLESVCYDCSGWLDEGMRKTRNMSLDTGGSVTYELQQKFLTGTGSVNASLQTVTTGLSGYNAIIIAFILFTVNDTNRKI